jgi:hypothetical protein
MKRENPKSMTTPALVARFAEIGVAQDEALLEGRTGEFNRLFDLKVAITEELKSRDGDQRRVLVELFRHPNMQVRLNAAKATLVVASKDARRMLTNIAASNHYPQAADARGSLRDLKSGFYKPT